ncbi:helix-turn-helix domain-containing protein [Rhodococcus sp. T7]|uniref:helix-turn-helix domain-containing protein n=1 Tax=Rhodococcus sp. T7 TaxID=627444 RepID=UPI001358CA5F|nr:LuxR C-terminal-related transcriptional regulator [Rhodococcus sp. T7]
MRERSATQAGAGSDTARTDALLQLIRVLRDHELPDHEARDLALTSAVRLLAESPTPQRNSQRKSRRELSAVAIESLRAELKPLQLSQQVRIDYLLDAKSVSTVDRRAAGTAGRFVTQAIYLLCTQPRVKRFHITWYVGTTQLIVTVRDDGPGELDEHWLRNEIDLGGLPRPDRTDVRCTPRWGTEVVMTHIIGQQTLSRAHLPREHPLAILNERECDVLNIVARGERNRSIAEKLGISENTVRFHVANILKKLNVTSRQEAAAKLIDVR